MQGSSFELNCRRCGRAVSQVREMFVSIGSLGEDPVTAGEPNAAICGDCLDHLVFAENPDAGGGANEA